MESGERRTRLILAVAAALAVIAVCGCGPADLPSDPVTKRDLVGSYYVKWEPYPGRNFGRETLTLKSDGTFTQIFVASSGHTFKNAGTWILERDQQGPLLHLVDVKNYVSPSYDVLVTKPQPEDGFIDISKHGRRIYLTISEDDGLYYKK